MKNQDAMNSINLSSRATWVERVDLIVDVLLGVITKGPITNHESHGGYVSIGTPLSVSIYLKPIA